MKKKVAVLSISLASMFVAGFTFTVLANKVPDAAEQDCDSRLNSTCTTLIVTPSGNYVQTVYDAVPKI